MAETYRRQKNLHVLNYYYHFRNTFLYFLVCLGIRPIASCNVSNCNETSSVQNYRLYDHVLLERRAESIFDCIKACDEHRTCRSVNYRLLGLLCQLNKADVHIAPHSYIPTNGYVYGDNPWLKIKLKSCADIKQIVPDAKSGYYRIYIKGEKKEVFCDMVNYARNKESKVFHSQRMFLAARGADIGGGWTLVVSIGSSNNNHLDRGVVNCLLPNRCVEYVTSNIPTRKLPDEEIHEIATTEGTFRVDVITGGYTAFFQIPIGADAFNSECSGIRCPRIIVSHAYPYQWESNCKGTELGYHIYSAECYRVFDMHDNNECGGVQWLSTKFSTNRVLYGYSCSSFGIHNRKQGLLFVK